MPEPLLFEVHLLADLDPLADQGVGLRLVLLRRVAWARQLALVTAAVLFLATALVPVPAEASALPVIALLLPGITVVAALASATWPARRVTRFAAPVLALALVGLMVQRAVATQSHASFQRPQMLRARATFARAVEPRAVVITTEDVGRPAENIDYYSGVAHAFYMTDLMRWNLQLTDASTLLLAARMVPYLLIPPSQPGHDQLLQFLRLLFTVDLVARVPPKQAMDYFVAAPFHSGVAMELYRIKPKSG